MAKNNKIKKAIYIASAFFVFFIVLVSLRNYYQNSPSKQKPALKVTVEKPKLDTLIKRWKYISDDNPQYALANFNDSSWKSISPELYTDSVNPELFNSVIWLRHTFSIDSSLTKKILAFDITHYGASEIYIDGKLMKRFGKVSAKNELEKAIIPELPVIFSTSDTKQHVLAIRYSNCNAKSFFEKYEENLGGIDVRLIPDVYDAIRLKKQSNALSFFLICLFGFSFTLFVVHFLLYLFYRKQKENLYFSLFMFVFSLVVIKPFMIKAIHLPKIYLFYSYHANLLPLFSLFLLVICMYVLFKPSHLKTCFTIGCALTLFVILTEYSVALSFLNFTAWFMIILYMGIESIRAVVTGIRQKQEGAKIVGVGVSVFFLIVLGAIFLSVITSQLKSEVSFGLSGLLIILLMMTMLMSIPLSMSIYLARKFAITNQSLENKLMDVEQLSEKTIQQEKEKQQILASQNEYLENQVEERTREVVKQKEIIEDKHKEITDSISYAKRLQQAILPPFEFITENISSNFILYKPKDIVAGDFYWAEKMEEKFFIAAADCTGHGVPGAMVSVVCSNALNRCVKEFGISDTGKILDKTRELVVETFAKSNSDVKDGMDISILCIDKKNNKVFWSGANNPLWYIEDGEIKEIKADKQPIGKTDNPKPFTTHEIELKTGIQFYLFTDGFADQFGGPRGKKYKYKQLSDLLLANCDLEMKQQMKQLEESFEVWKGSLEQVDDVCVVGVNL